MAAHDLVIRGGRVFDGSGDAPYEGDVAVSGGRIVHAGPGRLPAAARGAEEIDARGLIVTPGFVDIHTHYDGQAAWDRRLWPSSWHGVTTAVMSNCGVGFAPCRPADHDMLIRLMEGVEDIPGAVLHEGLSWEWETLPEYLSALERLPHDIDIAAQVPHGPLRVYVMGERGADREPATPEDIAEMARLAAEGVEAGALGFTTSRTLNHRTSDGQPTPTLTAAEDELTGIAMGLKEAGRGVLQVVSDFEDPVNEFLMLRRMVEASGRPLSISLAQHDRRPEGWRALLDAIGAAAADGLPIKAQVCGRPVGLLLGLELTLNPFSAHPAWREVAERPHEEKLRMLRDTEFRRRLLTEEGVSDNPFVKAVLGNFDRMFPLSDPPDYEPRPEQTVAALARARGIPPAELALDLMLEKGGRGMLYFPFLNYSDQSLEPSHAMLLDAHTVPGLGDGGAHVGMICDASFTTSLITHWTRDRTRGPLLPLEFVVKAQCADTAAAVGLADRGRITPGYKADLNVIDHDRLHLHAPEVRFDLPAGGRRLLQRAEGYVATVVSGQIIYREGEATDALPGRLVRGAQGAPEHQK